ncbi:hypothetical protein KAT92_05900 [Candidatus Babeliales bacterium]|nr:hypothetical protein [Candidatus Babeliales bacterium]
MKRITMIALAVLFIATLTAIAYDYTPADYLATDFDEAIPIIVEELSISQKTAITSDDLPLLDIFFSDNQMLAWKAALESGSITTWTQVDELVSHAFEKVVEDGVATYQAKKDRKVVGATKLLILQLFFVLEEE